MKAYLVLGRVVMSAALGLLATPAGAEEQRSPMVRLSQDLDLTPAEQTVLAAEAINGSPEAARKLANFHIVVRGDREATLKWYTVGAENGDAGCAYGLYGLLRGSADEEERARSLFWLHKAADTGLKYAQDELRALKK